MEHSIHEYVVRELLAARGRWPQIASASGISRRTLEKIARGEIKNPGVKHIETLARYFTRTPAEAAQ